MRLIPICCAVRPGWRHVFGALLVGVLLLVGSGSAPAHEGHNHEEKAPDTGVSVVPKTVAQTSQFELVGRVEAGRLIFILDDFQTNEPVLDAQLEVTADGTAYTAMAAPGGTYVLTADWLSIPGSYDLIISVATADAADLLVGTLEIPDPVEDADTDLYGLGDALFWLAGLVALGLGFGAGRLTQRKASAAASVGLAIFILLPLGADAHEGHAHDEEAFPVTGDQPRRLPDGNVFLPKVTQRLLSIRTMITKSTQAPRSATLLGRSFPDPNASGVVQATQDGQIVRGRSPLPTLGQRVAEGAALALLKPALSTDARTDLADQTGALDQQIALAEQRYARLSAMEPVRLANGQSLPPVSAAELTDIRSQLEGLRRRRQAVLGFVSEPRPILASATGTITRISVRAGQLVSAGDTLFEIVDPARVWVEARAFPDQTLGAVERAEAILSDGTVVPLIFVGRSASLAEQSLVMHFRVDGNTMPAIGAAVTVRLLAGISEPALIVPNDAVVRSAAGLDTVWLHTEPERFEPQIVHAVPFDGSHRLIRSGLEPDMRIVVQGAAFLEQVR